MGIFPGLKKLRERPNLYIFAQNYSTGVFKPINNRFMPKTSHEIKLRLSKNAVRHSQGLIFQSFTIFLNKKLTNTSSALNTMVYEDKILFYSHIEAIDGFQTCSHAIFSTKNPAILRKRRLQGMNDIELGTKKI